MSQWARDLPIPAAGVAVAQSGRSKGRHVGRKSVRPAFARLIRHRFGLNTPPRVMPRTSDSPSHEAHFY
ncbi:hypothetical protein AFLA_011557 [Aspergillus flavus NRRL3357]|nr:hypothetical protein AFLA_011557 [Aspergillus flavus NRRL3357]